MADFTRLLGPLSQWLWKFFEKSMREALTFSAEIIFDREACSEKSGFIPIRVNIRPGLLQTRIKAICVSDCTICVDEEYLGKCGRLGQWQHRPRKSEPYEGRLDLKNWVAPARADAQVWLPFIIWVRPNKKLEEITITMKTSSWIQPPEYVIVL